MGLFFLIDIDLFVLASVIGNHASVALDFRLEVHVLLAEVQKLMVTYQQLLAQLDHLMAGVGDLILHVSYEQVLVELVNVGNCLEVVAWFFLVLGLVKL